MSLNVALKAAKRKFGAKEFGQYILNYKCEIFKNTFALKNNL